MSEWGALNVLVYPSGFEPEVDGVGGRNVIQLHHEYVSSALGACIYYYIYFLTDRLPIGCNLSQWAEHHDGIDVHEDVAFPHTARQQVHTAVVEAQAVGLERGIGTHGHLLVSVSA